MKIIIPSYAGRIVEKQKKEDGNMERNNIAKLKKIVLIWMIICFTLMNMSNVYAASGKDVTSKYKSSATKLLRNFDSYFGWGCKKGSTVKYNIYARSVMAFMGGEREYGGLYQKSLPYVQNKIKKYMKLYFGTNELLVYKKSRNISDAFSIAASDPLYRYQNINGKVCYIGGNWAETAVPRGYVSKVIKKSNKKCEVTYKIMWYDTLTHDLTEPCEYTSYTRHMGTYKITLKKANNRYGFVIKNVKRTKANIYNY